MMNINTRLLALALWLECGFAFQFHRQAPTTMKLFVTDNNPFRQIDIDIELAEDCAKNFGKHSVDEIEQCRDELHAHRVQSIAMGGETTPDIIKERFLETELTMQLDELQSGMPEKYLFAEDESFHSVVDADMNLDGVVMDNGLVAMDLPDLRSSKKQIPESSKIMMMEELAEEGVLESVAICALLGLMMITPTLFG